MNSCCVAYVLLCRTPALTAVVTPPVTAAPAAAAAAVIVTVVTHQVIGTRKKRERARTSIIRSAGTLTAAVIPRMSAGIRSVGIKHVQQSAK